MASNRNILDKYAADGVSTAVTDKERFEELVKQRFFYIASAEIYGGVAGLYDLGPVGTALEAQIVDQWKRHFIYEDAMLEVRSCQLTPYQVLEASGHVKKFSDVLVKDSVTGEAFRCDHLIKAHLEKLVSKAAVADKEECEQVLAHLDNFTKADMGKIIAKYSIKSPTTGNVLTEPVDFNLMFSSNIGPTANLRGFLRPETAQGIFVNFKRLLEFNSSRLPFAAAQVGLGFRNEISPRSGLNRCREFMMAEVEHFVHPDQKCHAKFGSVADLVLPLLSSACQLENKPPRMMDLATAVEQKIIANNVIAYYLGRTYLFLQKLGIDCERVRFRQHLPNEMAHYACDCWDTEIHSFYGWVECSGCADRACYDLVQHSNKSGQKLSAQLILSTPEKVTVPNVVLDKGVIGKQFRELSKAVIAHLESLTVEGVNKVKSDLQRDKCHCVTIGGETFKLTENMFKTVELAQKEVAVRDFYPHVVEPSFGIGRIMYSLLTHACMVRNVDHQRLWFKFPHTVAPIKCAVLSLSSREALDSIAFQIAAGLGAVGIQHRTEIGGSSIGKRYAKIDELGVPFVVTVDFDSLQQPTTVTLRERDSTQQIRVQSNDVVQLLQSLLGGKTTWSQLVADRGLFQGQKSLTGH